MSNKKGIDVFICTVSEQDLENLRVKLGLKKEDVRLPSGDQTVLDAPKGFVGVYVPAFEEGNLRMPMSKFYLAVLKYFKCHISYMHPLGTARAMVFEVLCRAYGGEPTVELFRAFYQTGNAGDWVTLQKRGKEFYLTGKYDIRNWKSSFFFLNVEKIPADYVDVLNPKYRRVPKQFRDPKPENYDKVLYERLWKYQIELTAFPEAVLFMARVAPRWEGGQEEPVAICGDKGRCFLM